MRSVSASYQNIFVLFLVRLVWIAVPLLVVMQTVAAVKDLLAVLALGLVFVLHVGLERGDHSGLADGAVEGLGQHGCQGGADV